MVVHVSLDSPLISNPKAKSLSEIVPTLKLDVTIPHILGPDTRLSLIISSEDYIKYPAPQAPS